ncbi:MAG: ABC transporter permease [Treponemataceae bacterium]
MEKTEIKTKTTFVIFAQIGKAVFVSVLLLFFVPLVASFLPIANMNFSGEQEAKKIINFQFFLRLLKSAGFTCLQASLSSLLAVIIGFSAAFFCANRSFWGRKFLLSLAGIPLAVPSVIIALSFIIFFGKNGFLNSKITHFFNLKNPLPSFLYSFWGLIITQAFYNFPIAMRTISQRWSLLNEDEQMAAKLLGAKTFRIFRTIIFPVLLPSVLASFTVIFLYCFFSFVIVLLFGKVGVSVLEVELFQAIRSGNQVEYSTIIILFEICISSVLVLLYLHVQKKMQLQTGNLKPERKRKKIKGFAEKLSFSITIFLIVFFLCAPLFSIIVRSFFSINYSQQYYFSLKAWSLIFSRASFWRALLTTITVSSISALISLITCLAYSYLKIFKTNKLNFLEIMPLVISPLALSFGWSMIMHKGSVFVLIFAQSALTWPFVLPQIQIAINRIPTQIINAAKLVSTPYTNYFLIIIPLIAKECLIAFAFAFAISAGDATLPLVLSIPGFENLSLLVFRLAAAYRFSESAAVAVILAAISSSVFFLEERS